MAILRIIFAFVFVLLAISASARLNVSGSAADFSFPNGTLNTCATTGSTTNNTLNFPVDVFVYNNLLMIVDNLNSRVLAVDQTTNEAVAVFGQPNFTTKNQATTATGLNLPFGIYVDAVLGTLYIADSSNNRVTSYALAGLATGGNNAATSVIGQTDFTTNTSGLSQTKLNGPRDVFFEAANSRLWVLDYANKRVLWFNVGILSVNGQAASGVVGTANTTDFTSVGTFLQTPNGVLVDLQGRLYIADTTSNRVVRYDDATNNVPSLAFGQPDLTSTVNTTTATGLDYPRSLAYDFANDVLYVSDLRNNRVLGYANASNITTNGTAASIAVGQSSLTASAVACSPTGLASPYGIYFNDAENTLAVADDRNQRALVYNNNITQVNASQTIAIVSIVNSTSTVAASISPSGLCVACQSTRCGSDTQFNKICTTQLKGTPGRVGDSYCCQGATRTTGSSFKFGTRDCVGKQKLQDLCTVLGGTPSCSKRSGSTNTHTTTTCRY